MKRDYDVIEGRWRVKGELDYSGPTRTPKEEWQHAGRQLSRLVTYLLTALVVFGVARCTQAIEHLAGWGP
jgi:hypothetical protein